MTEPQIFTDPSDIPPPRSNAGRGRRMAIYDRLTEEGAVGWFPLEGEDTPVRVRNRAASHAYSRGYGVATYEAEKGDERGLVVRFVKRDAQ